MTNIRSVSADIESKNEEVCGKFWVRVSRYRVEERGESQDVVFPLVVTLQLAKKYLNKVFVPEPD